MDASDQLAVVVRELRGWRVSGADEEVVRVRFLDQIESETGLSLVEVGGSGARLDSSALRTGLIAEIASVRATWGQITVDLEQARARWRLAARALSESGMSTTQISRLLGVSRPAVDKLLYRAAEDSSDQVPTATGLNLVGEVEAARAQVEKITRKQAEFSDRWATVAFNLMTALHSDRDAAFLLGITRQRIHQLAKRTRQAKPAP